MSFNATPTIYQCTLLMDVTVLILDDFISNYYMFYCIGHVMASTKDELLRILDHFNIQV